MASNDKPAAVPVPQRHKTYFAFSVAALLITFFYLGMCLGHRPESVPSGEVTPTPSMPDVSSTAPAPAIELQPEPAVDPASVSGATTVTAPATATAPAPTAAPAASATIQPVTAEGPAPTPLPSIPSVTELLPDASAATPAVTPVAPAPIATPVVAPAPAADTTGPRTYIVKKGDTLARIARRELGNEARWREIMAENKLPNAGALRMGMTLRLPGSGTAAVPSASSTTPAPVTVETAVITDKAATVAGAPTQPAASASKVRTHTIATGETLGTISKKYYGSTAYWKVIRDANKSAVPNPNVLTRGTQLTIPEKP